MANIFFYIFYQDCITIVILNTWGGKQIISRDIIYVLLFIYILF